MAYRRNPGLGGRGMGDTCPSLEQLQGVVDIMDPCQGSAVANLPITSPTLPTLFPGGTVAPAQFDNPISQVQAYVSANPSLIYWGVGGVLLFLVVSSLGGRRR
jgi:hypothetical protein